MIIIGLTGPSGSGKGEVSAVFERLGCSVINADEVYHEILIPPSNCLDELVANFGEEILDASGRLCRPSLSRLVFGEQNKDKLLLLNSIAHRYVVLRINEICKDLAAKGTSVCVIDAPLLIEAGISENCDLVISVLADKDVRADRICKRDSVSIESAYLRINSQKDDEFYIRGSDKVIYNDGALDNLEREVKKIYNESGALTDK